MIHDIFRDLGERGLFRALSSRATLEEGCQTLRSLAREADALGPFLSVIATAGLGLPILERGGGALFEDARRGRAVVAVAITERGAGSDVSGMKTALTRDRAGDLRLSGAKWHVTNAPVADAMIVFAVDETTPDRHLVAVLVRAEDRGVRRGPPLDLIGCHGSPTGELFFDDVLLSPERILGERHEGRALLDLAFARERVLAPWPLLGKMEHVLGLCLDHVEERRQFGEPLHTFQYVQEKIVSSFQEMIHARHLAERAVALVAGGKAPGAIGSLAKAAAADAAAHTFRAAIEIFGSYGVQTERRFGAWLADALCAQIAGGTRETHKKVVFGELRVERARMRRGRPSDLLGGAR